MDGSSTLDSILESQGQLGAQKSDFKEVISHWSVWRWSLQSSKAICVIVSKHGPLKSSCCLSQWKKFPEQENVSHVSVLCLVTFPTQGIASPLKSYEWRVCMQGSNARWHGNVTCPFFWEGSISSDELLGLGVTSLCNHCLVRGKWIKKTPWYIPGVVSRSQKSLSRTFQIQYGNGEELPN